MNFCENFTSGPLNKVDIVFQNPKLLVFVAFFKLFNITKVAIFLTYGMLGSLNLFLRRKICATRVSSATVDLSYDLVLLISISMIAILSYYRLSGIPQKTSGEQHPRIFLRYLLTI